MSALSLSLLATHFVLLFILCLFGLHRLSMVLRWLYYRKHTTVVQSEFNDLPKVTVQVPLYNEQFVARRVVDAVAALDYPTDKLQIQIIDDSNDETCDIIAEQVALYQQQGINIQHVQRSIRQGYKAGALKDAMQHSSGEFIAIFDADFLPQPSLLKDTIHHFTDSKVGMLQFRWEHLNRDSSRLTETQAILLDAHFGLEQTVRFASGAFLNFNGTAGIWRESAIIDSGHWCADTLTEDLDLSYRAQLRGWKMRYLNNVSCGGEIPADMNAFKSQQHRWAKGGIEVMLKMLPKVWAAPIKLRYKIESSFHLANNLAYLLMLVDTIVFLIPSIWIRDQFNIEYIWWLDLPLLLLATGGHMAYLVFGQFALGRSRRNAILSIPRLFLIGIQLSFNNARAATEALRGQSSEFVRTPKSGELKTASANSQKSYKAVAPRGAFYELLLAVIFSVVLAWGVVNQHWLMLPFVSFLVIGYASTAISSFISYQQLKN